MITVFTNGIFDLLHVDHIRLLEFARESGDYLIVGLNSDKSTRGLKGEGRPIIPQEQRKEMLEAVKYVDEVIIFDNEPEELIKMIRPHILVKGPDWVGKELSGEKYVKKVLYRIGDSVQTTTSIIAKIRNTPCSQLSAITCGITTP